MTSPEDSRPVDREGHTALVSSGTPRRPGRLRMMLGALAAIGLIATGCGDGSTDNGSPSPTDGDGAGGSALVDPDDCPVDALDDATEPVDLMVWHAWLGKAGQTLEALARDFNASQDKVRVHVESQGAAYEEMHKKFTDAMDTPGSLPDLLLAQDTNLQFLIDSGTVIPADACVAADPEAQEVYDDFEPAVISAYTVEDVMWPAMFNVSQPVLYVNRKHFQAAGLDPDDPPATLAEVREAAETIAAARDSGVAELKGVKKPMVLRLDSAWMENWVTGAGTPMVDNDNGRSGLATESEMMSDTVTEVVTWLHDMADDDLLKPIPFSDTFGQLFSMALQESSILIETSTAITTVDAAIDGTLRNEDIGAEDLGIDLSKVNVGTLDVGVGPNPGLTDAGRGQVGGAAWYIIDRNEPASIAASWAFIRFVLDTPQQVTLTLEGSYLPIRRSARNDAAVVAEFNDTRRGQWLAVAADAVPTLDAEKPGPVVGPYNEFRDIYRNALEKATTAGSDVASTLSESNDKFNTALDAYRVDVGS